MKKIIFAGLFVGQQLLSQSLFATDGTMTLQELKEKCRQYEQNSQVVPFTSSFTCSEDRTFYSKIGEQTLTLENESNFSIKALIKDGSHKTTWWTVSHNAPSQTAHCPVLEQYKATARHTVTVNSCDQLDQINSEEEYCKEKLRDVWEECSIEMENSPFVMPKSSMCEYESIGNIKQCVDTDTAQQDTAQQDTAQQDTAQQDTAQQDTAQQDTAQQDTAQQDTAHQDSCQQDASQQDASQQDVSQQDASQQDASQQDASQQDASQQDASQQENCEETSSSSSSCENESSHASESSSNHQADEANSQMHHNGSSSSHSHSSMSQSSSSDDSHANVQQKNSIVLGSQVKMIEVNRGFMHASHRVVQVLQDPSVGSLLSKMGLKKDNVISRINGVRVRDLSTFVRMLKLAKSQRKVAIEYRNSQNAYVTVRVTL